MLKYSTLVELLRIRAQEKPEGLAYTFLVDGEKEAARLTYLELDKQAQAIAAQLQSLGATGERALLIYSPGLEFISAFFGCLYAGIIGIPVPLPDPARLKRTLPRLQLIAQDAQASLVLTQERNRNELQEASAKFFVEFELMRWIATDKISPELAQQWQEPELDSNSIAYLQYTSGSTSTPKGVVLTHENLIHQATVSGQAWGYTNQSIATTWLPYFHDYGLVDGLIQPFYSGIPCYVMSPLAFYMRPIRWLQTISRYRVTHTQAPNFAYDHCIRKLKPAQLETLDLSSWQTASNGAEPVRKETLALFTKTFAPCGFRQETFYPSYGLAETTLLVSTKPHGQIFNFCQLQADALAKNQVLEAVSEEDKLVRTIISCGFPINEFKVVIVNTETLTACAADEVGEIWVSSLSVAKGYWQNVEATKNTFEAYLADTKEGPFLRTGDLGFLQNGELYVTGRIKDVIIIRGRNYYPQDIELTVEKSHTCLRPDHGAAFSVEIKGEEKLVVVQEVERNQANNLNLQEVIGNICEAITEEHELQVHQVILIKAGSISKTSSGKIQRSACRQQYLEKTLNVV